MTVPTTYRAAWSQSSVLIKTAVIAVGLIVLLALAVGGKSWWQNRAYEKREAARMVEREQLQQEKAQLQSDLATIKGKLAEQEASNEALKVVAESKRSDRDKAVAEIDAIEREHAKHKAELEAGGNTISDDELRRELCEMLRSRGYKLQCN